ncbi:hypothetical protein [Jeongeupia sp. USM3]|uniref:hypothetical protein n=1 Tax=Jeongeupia sp. USM3 TaxID=1906741 RepID=UPI00089DF23F|nr:hypothetical protein [Jeongeupia sp. USM3]AOY01051.1 hypothetical protein BJP62_11725 [Jeongeupia sp. USM3]
MKHILIALCLLLGLSAPALARQGLMQDPPKLAITQSLDADQVRSAIVAGAASTKWQTRDVAPGRIEATLDVGSGKHIAKVTIEYDTQTVQIRYLDSFNLKYETVSDGRVFIHPNYNKWTASLAAAIRSQLNQQAQTVTTPLAQ